MVDKPASPWYYAGATGGITNNTAVTLTPGAVAGQRYFLTALQFANTSITASEIVIIDGATSNVIWRGYAAPSAAHAEEVNFDPPLQSAQGSSLQLQMVTAGSATRVSAQGFVDP